MNTFFPPRIRPVFSQEANQHPIIKQLTPTEKQTRIILWIPATLPLSPPTKFLA